MDVNDLAKLIRLQHKERIWDDTTGFFLLSYLLFLCFTAYAFFDLNLSVFAFFPVTVIAIIFYYFSWRKCVEVKEIINREFGKLELIKVVKEVKK